MKQYISILFVVFITSCAYNSKKEIEPDGHTQEIVCKFDFDDTDILNLIDTIEYIALETTDESVIGNIEQLHYLNETFYIFDDLQQKILFFDKNGKYISSLDRKGQGPCEYTSIHDMHITENGVMELLTWSADPVKISKYSFDAFSQCKEVNFNKIIADNFIKTGNNYIFYQANGSYIADNRYFLIQTDSAGNITNRWLPSHSYLGYHRHTPAPFQLFCDTTLFYKPLNSNIYQITPDDEISIRYFINFGQYNLPAEVNKLYEKNLEQFHIESANYVQDVDFFYETQQHLFFSFVKEQFVFPSIYSKDKNQLALIKGNDHIAIALLNPKQLQDNYFFSSVSPNDLTFDEFPQYIDMIYQKYSGIKSVLEKCDAESNPVILKYRLK